MLRANCCWILNVCWRKTTSSLPRSAPKKTTSRARSSHASPAQHVAQPHAREPSVGRESLHRARAVAGALVPVDDLHRLHGPQLRQREFGRLVDHTGELQLEGGRVELRLVVVLNEKELVGRSEVTVDLPDIEEPIGSRGVVRIERGRDIGKRHVALALGKRGVRPLRDERDQTPRQAHSDRLSSRHQFRHCGAPCARPLPGAILVRTSRSPRRQFEASGLVRLDVVHDERLQLRRCRTLNSRLLVVSPVILWNGHCRSFGYPVGSRTGLKPGIASTP